VIAGEVFGVKGPVEAKTPTYYIDMQIKKGQDYEHVIPKGWNSMVVVHQGQMILQDNSKVKVSKSDCAVFEQNNDQDEIIKFSSLSDETRFMLLAGQPMNEPIAAQGPFVLNEREQLVQAF
jgi:redox-sensitive bicupin YhaK (pirin superfamily)